MKVLIVHNAYQSRLIGGEEVVVAQEIAQLKIQLGHGNVFEYQVSNDHLRKIKLLWTLWGSSHTFKAITALVKKHQIDIVHVHNFFPLLTPTVFQAAAAAGAAVIHTLHNYRWWCLSGVLYRKDIGICEECVYKKISLPAIRHRCYRNSFTQSLVSAFAFAWYRIKHYQQYIDAYFVLSHFQKEKLAAFVPPEKLYLKANGVAIPLRVIAPTEKQHYVFVGRLEEAKGIRLLLTTWQKLPLDFHLDIIGEGEAKWEHYFARSNIRFLGKMAHTQALEKIAKAKYLVHPALAFETFGLTMLEALSQGTPVIAINVGPRAELVQSGYNGFLCHVADFEQTLLTSKTYPAYERLSHHARESAKVFDAHTLMQQQIELYNVILKKKGR